MKQSFGDRLQERIRALGPLCVGIDPSARLLTSWERGDDVSGLEFAALATLEAVSDVAVAVKPQVGYFERFGSAGYVVLERVIAEATDRGLLVIADAKRGDIYSTNAGYADAWLSDRSPLAVDALTVSPYLGFGAMTPFFERAVASSRGVFVVVASTNEEGRVLQTATTASNDLVEDYLLQSIAEFNEQSESLGALGAVVGATRDLPRTDLAALRGPILAPGAGAQGANAEQVGRLFARCTPGTVLVNVARAIGDAGPDKRALRDAAQRWRDDLSIALA